MRDVLYLAWRYLAHHRLKTAILIASIALIVYLPVGLNVLVSQSAAQLTARAESTPLLVGAKGSPLELVLNSLYFESETPATSTYAEVERIAASGLADPVPLYVRFRSRSHPIVGTSLEYFPLRGLRLAAGRAMALLGECVLGAEAARALDAAPGDSVVSSPESVFDLAGVYPLRMKVVGVLERVHTPDDRAIFVDLKTAWIIAGLGHGHQDLATPEAASAVLSRSDERITANASVVQYNEITSDNIDSFHFHGALGRYPLTGVIAVPKSERAGVILLGRYEGADEVAQILPPARVMDELLDTILTIQSYVLAAVAVLAAATLATAGLVFWLGIRLRGRELETLWKIGGSRGAVAGMLVSEVVVVLVLAIAAAGGLTALTSRFGSAAIRSFLLL